MSLKTAEELNTLDIPWWGEPWCGVAAKTITNGTLDYVFGAEPFIWADPASVGQPRVFIST